MNEGSPIDETLNLSPLEEETTDIVPAKSTTPSSSLADGQTGDFEHARENLHEVLGRSKEALDDLLQYAQQAQHPRAYEVLNQMLRTVADVSGALTDLHLKAAKLEVEKQKAGTHNINNKTVNNNMFIGSTADLQKMLKSVAEQDQSNIIDVEVTDE